MGKKKLTTKEFIERSLTVHGDRYDYSLVDYKTISTNVTIICRLHGEFRQTPTNHLYGCGCKQCAVESTAKRNRLTTSEFIKKAKLIHGDKYNYSKVNYEKSDIKATIICPEHGEFIQSPHDHLSGCGCPQCGNNSRASLSRLSPQQFIKKAKNIHGDRYDYARVDYKNTLTKVVIVCPKHGEFKQRPDQHLRGEGCPICARVTIAKKNSKSKLDFISDARMVHGQKYDYSKVIYKNNKTKVIIICNQHGEFKQTPNSHLNGEGCRKCSIQNRAKNQRLGLDKFIRRSNSIHRNKYDYSLVVYRNNREKVTIICPVHGKFRQIADSHMNGSGCKECASRIVGDKARYSTNDFIKKAKTVHGDRYDYSKVDYTNSRKKIVIICPNHGEFQQSPAMHMSGNGCPTCGQKSISNRQRYSTDDFVEKAKIIHGGKYDYSKVDYISSTNAITIICPKHGEYQQLPVSHLQGRGCRTCNESTGETYISSILSEWQIPFERQKRFIACKSKKGYTLPFDFYFQLDGKVFLVEYDGAQHFIPVDFSGMGKEHAIKQFKALQERDKTKNEFAKKYGIILLRIPYTEKDNIKTILRNELNKYIGKCAQETHTTKKMEFDIAIDDWVQRRMF